MLTVHSDVCCIHLACFAMTSQRSLKQMLHDHAGDAAKAKQPLANPPANGITLQAASVRTEPQTSKQQRDAAIRKALAATKQQQAAGSGPQEVSAETGHPSLRPQ